MELICVCEPIPVLLSTESVTPADPRMGGTQQSLTKTNDGTLSVYTHYFNYHVHTALLDMAANEHHSSV